MPIPPGVAQEEQVEEAVVASSFSSKPAESDSVKVMPPLSKNGIEVMALRAGFFKNARKNEGDKFTVPSMSKVGTWMKCVDPILEKEHQALMALMKEPKKAGI